MLLVLTYHKVLDRVSSGSDFYATDSGQFERQLLTLGGSGLRGVLPSDLASGLMPQEDAFLLTFDDGTADHYEIVCEILDRQRLRGVFFVPTALVGTPGYLRASQLREMKAAGHSLGSHSHEHKQLTLFEPDGVRMQLELSKKVIEDAVGESPTYFAPPGGYANRHIYEIARESGMKVLRTMRWGYNRGRSRRLLGSPLECIPLNRYVTERSFERILERRDQKISWYWAKEAVKNLLPYRYYAPMRSRISRWF